MDRLKTINYICILKTIMLGSISLEVFYFSKIVANSLGQFVILSNCEYMAITISIVYFLIILLYMYIRGFFKDFFKILKSRRWDIFIAFIFGCIIDILFGGFGSNLYSKFVSAIAIKQLVILVVIPMVLIKLLILREIQINFIKKNKKTSYFINDVEKQSTDSDLLDFTENAKRFSEYIFNNGSYDSIVFGIDAPWGIGKSSFVNFCKEYLREKYSDQIIIYDFNPIRYEGRADILERFIDGLVCAIQKECFIPEIRPLFSRYANFIKGAKVKFSFLGLDFELFSQNYDINDALKDLEAFLVSFNKKIVIVIDDLDRLNFSSIKDILFVIKKSFTLPNISYVLCYDTENINALEKDNVNVEKISEFLEKFVNIKISLYLSSEMLMKYVSSNFNKVLIGNSKTNPMLVSKAMGGLINIYKSKDYHYYVPFIGDIRKIKRLINIIILFDIEKVDFDNSDFDQCDLINLLLIYINYPSVFRKIYNTETSGRKGFFSLVAPYEDGYPKEKNENSSAVTGVRRNFNNSTYYKEYIKSLSEKQKFLVNKVFDVLQRLSNTDIDDISQESGHTYACFNGTWLHGRNLEQYLNLIVNLSKPQKDDQYRFYLNLKNKVNNGETIQNILSLDSFSYLKGEKNHQQFWNVILNSANEFNNNIGTGVINYLLNNISDYSLLHAGEKYINLRHELVFSIVKLLDVVGWTDNNGKHENNSEENILEIAEWIFGEKRHNNEGIIKVLSEEKRGILGLYDLLLFRLFCNSNRGGNIYNVARSLLLHGGYVSDQIILVNEMREISQKVFRVFEEQYINKKINVFDLIEDLSLEDFIGKFFYEETKDLHEIADVLKSNIKSSIIYNLGNSNENSGFSCGYYDPVGSEDKGNINTKINDYLFEICFNYEIDNKNYEHFLDYLLINFVEILSDKNSERYVAKISGFTRILNKEKLISYWKHNSKAIKDSGFINSTKIIHQGNYDASYKDDLPNVFAELDNLIEQSK